MKKDPAGKRAMKFPTELFNYDQHPRITTQGNP